MWVEQQLNKHSGLETDRLVLVSWSGFSAAAKRKAMLNPGVTLITPEVSCNGDFAHALRRMELSLTADKVVSTVLVPDGTTKRIQCPLNLTVFDESGAARGYIGDLATEFLTSRAVHERIIDDARGHPTPNLLSYFVLSLSVEYARLSLQWEQPLELHRMLELELRGRITVEDCELPMTLARFKEMLFGYGTTTIFGAAALVVGRVGDSGAWADATMRVYAGPMP